jgi:6-phosphogluconolactonase
MKSQIRIFKDIEALSQAAAVQFVELAGAAIDQRGQFLVALSGGGTPQRLFQLLAAAPYRDQVVWAKVHVFWGDERCVPPNDRGSNYGQANQALLKHVPLPAENIHRVKGELEPKAASDDYAKILGGFAETGTPWPRFDLIHLGMGEDGHTASLFPGSDPQAGADSLSLAVMGHYQGRPAQRITLTLPVINGARQVTFLVAGENKAETLEKVLHGPSLPRQVPAQRVQPENGQLTWLVDEAAAKKL